MLIFVSFYLHIKVCYISVLMHFTFRAILFIFLIGQNFCFAGESNPDRAADIVTVVNKNLKQAIISKHGLSAVFKMRLLKWQDGTAVTVFVLADESPMHQYFCKKILNVFPYQMRKSWNQLVFSGSGQAPIQLESKEEMIRMVAATIGAIGYLSADDIEEGIKVLNIQSGSY